jgi:hypothetical protein
VSAHRSNGGDAHAGRLVGGGPSANSEKMQGSTLPLGQGQQGNANMSDAELRRPATSGMVLLMMLHITLTDPL